MKATDLMVGDYVIFKVGGEEKVIKIHANWLHDLELGIIDFTPIPLTQEILTENGFSGKNYSMGVVVIESKHVDEEGTEIEDWHVYVWSDLFVQAKNGFTIAKKHCKYVHELQQLLRFAGIEKEITL